MTYRELFHEIMFYGEFDRMPVIHWDAWPETMERWYHEGLPRDADVHTFLGTVPKWRVVGVNLGLWPAFEEETLEETDAYRIFRDGSGVILKDWKNRSCIPNYVDFTLKEAKDWDDFKRRLQPDQARIPKDLDQTIPMLETSGLPIAASTASLMGWIRNWMGVAHMAYLMYEAREVYADMVMTLADLTCWGLDQILPRLKVDMGFGWEDICGRNGPLVSPDIFEQCVAPGYRKIRSKLEEYGVTLYGIDSDGDVTDLVGPWLKAGVNVQFPLQVGPWKGDAMGFRGQYGKELRIIGNLDKLTLEESHEAIETEIERLLPLMKEGGFIILYDHHITPGVALDNYRWYLDCVRGLRF